MSEKELEKRNAKGTNKKGKIYISIVSTDPGMDTPHPKERHRFPKGKQPKKKATVSASGEEGGRINPVVSERLKKR